MTINHSLSFLVFAPNPWHDLWRNRQQLFSRLADRHRVLYVEPARASLGDWRRGQVTAVNLGRPVLVEERPNLWLYRIPPWLPTRGTGDAFDRLSDRLLARHLRRTLRHLGFYGPTAPHSSFIVHHSPFPILWLYRPNRWPWYREQFSHSAMVYHITDDYTAFTHLSEPEREALAADERGLLAAADLTVVTAPRLLALKGAFAKRIALVPNAVDFAAFRQALADRQPPEGLVGLPRPILGYSGHVSGRLDLGLLRDLALSRPRWQFAFAGTQWDAGCVDELAALQQLPNVHFLGRLPVAQVPHFIAACDVCLIPYRVNDETRAISSLKLYEYLAAGRPVVSAAVPAAEEHADVVGIAGTGVAAWQAAVEDALDAAGDPEAVAARQAVAAANTWDARVEQLEALLAEALAAARQF